MKVVTNPLLYAILFLAPAWISGAAPSPEHPKLPPRFEPNRGQAPSSADFISYGDGFRLLIERNGATLQSVEAGGSGVIGWRVVGAAEDGELAGLDRLPGVSSYFLGNNPSKWIQGAPHYESLKRSNIYDGIDLIYRGSEERAIEYDFVLAPGADPSTIALEFEGVKLSIDKNGDLVLTSGDRELRQKRPVLFQEFAGERRPIEGSFVEISENRVGFQVGEYDPGLPLVIDPVLDYSSYLGGDDVDSVRTLAVDKDGNTYLGGRTDSFDFPETNRIGGRGLGDAFVTKINAAGDAVLYSTVIGGAGDDAANAIAVNDAGEVFLTGFNRSLSFPVTADAFQDFYAGGSSDVFVSKLSADGTALMYSTYIGGSFNDFANGIAIDAEGNAYITGATSSFNYPTTAGAFQPIRGGFDLDIIVTKLNPAGTGLAYSTFIISEFEDEGYSIAVDAEGKAYVGGFTGGLFFPVTSNAFQRFCDFDGFVTKFNPAGSRVEYSTCLGGSRLDEVRGLAIDGSGTAYMTGFTRSLNFPVTQDNPLIRCGSAEDAFAARLNDAGSDLVFSGCLGGDRTDVGRGIALDSDGNAYVIGDTDSSDFPVTPDAISGVRQGGIDAFVFQVEAGGNALLSSTYLGGEREETGSAIAIGSDGRAHIGGSTDSGRFPTTEGAPQPENAGLFDGFVARLRFERQPPSINPGGLVNGAGFQPGPVSPGSIVAAFGQGFTTGSANSTDLPLPTTLAGATLAVNGVDTPLFFASPTQINFQLPVEVQPGEATAVVTLAGVASDPLTFTVVQAAPGVFNQGSRAVAQNEDGSMNSPANPAAPGEVVVLYLSGIGPTQPATQTNRAAPISPLYRATSEVSATIGGVDAPVQFLGLAPGFVGLGQANVVVPDVGAGEQALVITINGVASNPPTISVEGLP